MREIKFRYWDMVRKEFITDCDVYFVAEDIIFAGDLNNLPLVDVTGHVQMNQYTGLKDKNNKEIYEGDILKDKQPTIGIVKYFDGSYMLTTNYQGRDIHSLEEVDYMSQDLINDNFLEVIGNIYENPELLN